MAKKKDNVALYIVTLVFALCIAYIIVEYGDQVYNSVYEWCCKGLDEKYK